LVIEDIIKEDYEGIGFTLKVVSNYDGEKYVADLLDIIDDFNLEIPHYFLTQIYSLV